MDGLKVLFPGAAASFHGAVMEQLRSAGASVVAGVRAIDRTTLALGGISGNPWQVEYALEICTAYRYTRGELDDRITG